MIGIILHWVNLWFHNVYCSPFLHDFAVHLIFTLFSLCFHMILTRFHSDFCLHIILTLFSHCFFSVFKWCFYSVFKWFLLCFHFVFTLFHSFSLISNDFHSFTMISLYFYMIFSLISPSLPCELISSFLAFHFVFTLFSHYFDVCGLEGYYGFGIVLLCHIRRLISAFYSRQQDAWRRHYMLFKMSTETEKRETDTDRYRGCIYRFYSFFSLIVTNQAIIVSNSLL